MYLNVNQRVPVARETEEDFLVPIMVDVMASSTAKRTSNQVDSIDNSGEFVIGRMWAERWDLALSEDCGFNATKIADISGVWMQVTETIMRGGRRFRPELCIEGFVSDITFLHEILLHPSIEDRVAVVDAMIRPLVTMNSLVLMQYEQGESYHLEDREYSDLGFCKIARSNLLLKDNSLRYPFSDRFPGGKQVELNATAEQEQWLLNHWEKLVIDHPAL